jgi:hypothetical protein
VLAVVLLAAPMAASASAGAARSGRDERAPIAHLKVTADNVEVRRADSKRFRPAHDGQRLKEGDTVRTDETGRAEIEYTDDSFTRLDVETTFTIVRLTNASGDRRIKGSLDTGRTWNRTSALAESESFEVEGAGAIAAVAGTAFVVECLDGTCEFLAVVDVTTVTGSNHRETLGPGNAVDALNGQLGAKVAHALDELAGDDWVQGNLWLDQLRGIGGGPIVAAAATSSTGSSGGSGATSGAGSSTSSGTTGGTTPAVKPGCGKGDPNNQHAGNVPGC